MNIDEEQKEEALMLALEHWEWLKALLAQTREIEKRLFVDGFKHGYKHGVEAVKETKIEDN